MMSFKYISGGERSTNECEPGIQKVNLNKQQLSSAELSHIVKDPEHFIMINTLQLTVVKLSCVKCSLQ